MLHIWLADAVADQIVRFLASQVGGIRSAPACRQEIRRESRMLLYRARESGRVIIRAFGAGKLRFRHGSVQRRALGVVGLLYF